MFGKFRLGLLLHSMILKNMSVRSSEELFLRLEELLSNQIQSSNRIREELCLYHLSASVKCEIET